MGINLFPSLHPMFVSSPGSSRMTWRVALNCSSVVVWPCVALSAASCHGAAWRSWYLGLEKDFLEEKFWGRLKEGWGGWSWSLFWDFKLGSVLFKSGPTYRWSKIACKILGRMSPCRALCVIARYDWSAWSLLCGLIWLNPRSQSLRSQVLMQCSQSGHDVK